MYVSTCVCIYDTCVWCGLCTYTYMNVHTHKQIEYWNQAAWGRMPAPPLNGWVFSHLEMGTILARIEWNILCRLLSAEHTAFINISYCYHVYTHILTSYSIIPGFTSAVHRHTSLQATLVPKELTTLPWGKSVDQRVQESDLQTSQNDFICQISPGVWAPL